MKFDPIKTEEEISKFWQENKIYEKVKEKNKEKEEFYFLDGPPYTSGHIHLGTAWNKVMKDAVLRYKRMKGFNVLDRAGYDMHGLPIENKVMAELGLKTKEDIEKFGVDKFINECKKFALKHMKTMNEEFKRLGVWMDFDNAYKPITPEFTSGVWFLIKKAHEKNRLYKGKKTMHWCPSCATALAKHELEYKKVIDKSIFVKFKVKNENSTYLIIWTTTPWTIPFNLGIMVNPNISYVKAKVGNEIWILAEQLANMVIGAFSESDYKIIDKFPGKDLEGLEYEHPFYDTLKDIYDKLKKDHPKVHTVVLSEEYVDLNAGSGLVHMAPGCGPEDYEVGLRNGIPPFNNLDEYGVFPEEMGEFKGLVAKKDDDKFIEALKKRNALIGVSEVEHDYPFCWRCHNPVIFRTTEQWFFKVEDLKEKMQEFNKSIYWVPDWAGNKWFHSWLENLRDNSITRQRYWGTPVPIWVCDHCGHYEVIGSVEELKEKANKMPEDLHKPWIDEVTIKCPRCGKDMHRIKDVLDVWVDSGTASWNSLDYVKTKKFKPADFIIEGKDQIRGWFNLLMISSTIAFDNPSFKNVYMHGFVQTAEGEKMSKSLGNIIEPKEVINQYGADAFRFYSIGATNAGLDLRFSMEELKNKLRNLNVLYNIHNFLIQTCELNKINPTNIEYKEVKDSFGIEEKFMLSYLNRQIKVITELFDKYKIDEIPEKIEDLFLTLSRDYIKATRDKVNTGPNEDKEAVVYVIYNTLMEILKLSAPITPYLAEKIYQNLKDKFNLSKESIHLFNWPRANEELIDGKIEKIFNTSKEIESIILSIRDKIKRGIRWPIKKAYIFTKSDELNRLSEKYPGEIGDPVRKKANVKEIEFRPYELKFLEENLGIVIKDKDIMYNKNKYEVMDNNSFLIVIIKELNENLLKEGYLREIIRRIQNSRKELNLNKGQVIDLYLKVDKELKKYLLGEEANIRDKANALLLTISEKESKDKWQYIKEYKIKGNKLKIYINIREGQK